MFRMCPSGKSTSIGHKSSNGEFVNFSTMAFLSTYTISNSFTLTLTTNGLTLPCNGDCSGIVTANVSGSVGVPTFVWSPVSTSGTSTQGGLCAGTESVTVTDPANGCSQTASVTFVDPAAITSSTVSANVTCPNARLKRPNARPRLRLPRPVVTRAASSSSRARARWGSPRSARRR